MPRILCLGMSALDAIYRVPAIPTTPTKILATGFTECGGGMAANASVAVARLGGQAHYWGRVGDDALGTRILDQLAAEGVDVGSVRRIPGCVSPSAAILVDDRGERLVCAYNDPKLDADPSWLPLARIADFEAVLGDVRWPQGTAAVFDAARATTHPQGVRRRHRSARGIDRSRAARDPCRLFGAGTGARIRRSAPGDGLAEIARCVQGIVGVTLGEEGFLWREGTRERRIAAPNVVAVDTLAAGDVWHGAFTLGLAEGQDVAAAGRFANAAAAIKCSRAGGRLGAPTRDEVAKLLSSRILNSGE